MGLQRQYSLRLKRSRRAARTKVIRVRQPDNAPKLYRLCSASGIGGNALNPPADSPCRRHSRHMSGFMRGTSAATTGVSPAGDEIQLRPRLVPPRVGARAPRPSRTPPVSGRAGRAACLLRNYGPCLRTCREVGSGKIPAALSNANCECQSPEGVPITISSLRGA
jgi:hypothetical protein